MTHLRMLGLAMVAAMALVAVMGVGSASATKMETVLCKADQVPCAEGNVFPAGTAISSSLKAGTVAALQAGPAVVECSASTVAGSTSRATTPHGNITTLSFTSCNHTVHTKKPGTLEIHHTGSTQGNITVSGVEVEITIGSTICRYGGEITSGITATGGAPATVKAEANVPRISGALCNNPAKWTAEYVINSPNPLFISTHTAP